MLPPMKKVESTLTKSLRQVLRPRQRLLLAVSGGRDSVALLHACAQLGPRLNLHIEVAHVDHRLRKQSAGDALFVRELSTSNGFKFHLKRAPRRPARENLEDWARRVRYAFFSDVLKKRQLAFVLTAHTANDQAETLLMRLFQNREFAGISPDDDKRCLIRPFLEIERSEIDAYVKQNRLRFVEDPSNLDVSFLRNRIRHKLLPYIRRHFDPQVVRSLACRAVSLGTDADSLKKQIAGATVALKAIRFGSRAWLTTLRQMLGELHEGLSFRLLEEVFYPQLGYSLGRRTSAALRSFLTGKAPGLELPGAVTLRKRGGGLVLHRPGK